MDRGLKEEAMLHPSDASTGYVLERGEFNYSQALTPYPSWAWWGITDRITAELDFECWLGGVPSVNVRVGLLEQKGPVPSVAFETMFQYLGEERDQFENLDYLSVLRRGKSWYNHVNLSWRLTDALLMHASGGATYVDSVTISNEDPQDPRGASFENRLSPDASLSLDYRCLKWMSLHATASYGSTFAYADNIIRKRQICVAARVAPFVSLKWKPLRTFRVELAFLHASFPDADESITGPIGYAYWQWKFR